MTAGLRFDRYEWSGGQEAMLRFGPDTGPVVVVAMPLFEEANRTRAVVAAMLRVLAERDIAGALPDLPGQGDSLSPTEAMTLPVVRQAFAAAVAAIRDEGRSIHVAAIRSGALLDPLAQAGRRWHLSPQDGGALLRELTRIKRQEIGARALGTERLRDDGTPGESVVIAGNGVSRQLLVELPRAGIDDGAETPRRIVRLGSDPRPADGHVPGAPPWRRSEPGNDDALARLLADDLAGWIHSCAS